MVFSGRWSAPQRETYLNVTRTPFVPRSQAEPDYSLGLALQQAALQRQQAAAEPRVPVTFNSRSLDPPAPVPTPPPPPPPAAAPTIINVPTAMGGIESLDLSGFQNFDINNPLNPFRSAPAPAFAPAAPAANTFLAGGPPIASGGGGRGYSPPPGPPAPAAPAPVSPPPPPPPVIAPPPPSPEPPPLSPMEQLGARLQAGEPVFSFGNNPSPIGSANRFAGALATDVRETRELDAYGQRQEAAGLPAPSVPLTGGPPIGYQGGGGEYNPQNGYTDEDRIAADAFYAEQRRAQGEKDFAEREAAEPPPPAPVVETPAVEEDYVEVVTPAVEEDYVEVVTPAVEEDSVEVVTSPPGGPDTGTGPGIYTPTPSSSQQTLEGLLDQLYSGQYAYGGAGEALNAGLLTREQFDTFANAFNEYTGTLPGERPYSMGDVVTGPYYSQSKLENLLDQLYSGQYAYGDAGQALNAEQLTPEHFDVFVNAFNEYTGTLPGERPYSIGDIVTERRPVQESGPTPPQQGPITPTRETPVEVPDTPDTNVISDPITAFYTAEEFFNRNLQQYIDRGMSPQQAANLARLDTLRTYSDVSNFGQVQEDVLGIYDRYVSELEPERRFPGYKPFVPREFLYVVPEFARNFGPFSGFVPRPFTGGVTSLVDGEDETTPVDTGYTGISEPTLGLPPASYQPVPTITSAIPEYVQISGPSAPSIDPFSSNIQPGFQPLPSYERPIYSPQTQAMIAQILSEEEMANPFMNPYLRSGPFGR